MRYSKIERCSQAGVTLFELIAVIAILSIILVIGSGSILSLTQSNRLVDSQSNLMVNSQLLHLRITKQLKQSLPNSFRITNNNRCLTFLPVVAQGFYLQNLPDQMNALPPTGNSAAISVSPYIIDSGSPLFMSVGSAASTEIYGSTSDSLVSIQSYTAGAITLTADHRWLRNSTRQHFYLTGNANAFCLVNDELRYYSDISPLASQVNLSGDYDLLSLSIQPLGTTYRVTSSADSCRNCVTLSFNHIDVDYQLNQVITVASRYAP